MLLFSSGVTSDLPEDITEKCVLCFEAAVANHMNVGDAIKKVQNEPLKEVDERFKGQRWARNSAKKKGHNSFGAFFFRYKGAIKFDYGDTNVTINVNKFAGGNSQSSVGIGRRK